MTDDKRKPEQSTAGKRATTLREERLAAALRENLRRRKAQARDRAAPAAGVGSTDPPARKAP
ncbi:MAG TPA: hypothetical protein VMU85_16995 [Stellaceae bacterium]|nr:hypothetical protein [Stellaceae bacterium]